jgi:uncharacterized protein YlxW (UPF0749 family)
VLDDQEAKAREIIKEDEVALDKLRAETKEKLAALSEKRTTAQEKLDGFRQQDEDKKIENLAKSMDIDQGSAPCIAIEGEAGEVPVGEKPKEDVDESKVVKDDVDVVMDIDDAGRGGREGDEVEY